MGAIVVPLIYNPSASIELEEARRRRILRENQRAIEKEAERKERRQARKAKQDAKNRRKEMRKREDGSQWGLRIHNLMGKLKIGRGEK